MRLAVAVTTLAVALTGAPKADATQCGRKCKARIAHKRCDQQHPRWCVWHVIRHQKIRGWQRSWLLRVPACESTWNPYAVSPGGHKGLYQFADGTWASTPYGHRSIFSAHWQPFAAAWMLRQGRRNEWACR